MFQPQEVPLAGSLIVSGLVGLTPLVALFVLLGVVRVKAQTAGLTALVIAILISVIGFHMPLGLALLAASEGAVFGLFPIMWIVLNAVWLYQVTVVSGRFEDLRRSFQLISDDPGVQAIVIAFCFGGLLEALAGFGAPVAITAVMLMGVGFTAMRAASVALLANTAAVAYGAIATPIITAGTLTGISPATIGSYVGRQTPILAVMVPFLLAILVDGTRGLRRLWPVAGVVGVTFGAAQFASSNYASVELTDVVASLASLFAAVAFLRVWHPKESTGPQRQDREQSPAHARLPLRQAFHPPVLVGPGRGPGYASSSGTVGRTTRSRRTIDGPRMWMAFLPYLIVVAVFSVAKLWTPAKTILIGQDRQIRWPGLSGHVLNSEGEPAPATIYTLQWLSSPGTLLLICGIVITIVYRLSPAEAIREMGAVVRRMGAAMLTVSSVVALAYVMNLSGQTITIGTWIAAAGSTFAFLSPILGWLGTAVTGSDTSANALFSTLQQTVGRQTGIDPTLLVAANTSGGVLGKMISPQNLAIAATAVGLAGCEALIFRRVIGWSLGLLAVLCTLVYLQSTPFLSWML